MRRASFPFLLAVVLAAAAAGGCATGGIGGARGKAGPPSPRVATDEQRKELFGKIAALPWSSDEGGGMLRDAYLSLASHLAAYPGDRTHPDVSALEGVLWQALLLSSRLESATQEAEVRASRAEEAEVRANRLAKESVPLKEQIERLERENDELRTVVETLKAMELDMEEKRRRIR